MPTRTRQWQRQEEWVLVDLWTDTGRDHTAGWAGNRVIIARRQWVLSSSIVDIKQLTYHSFSIVLNALPLNLKRDLHWNRPISVVVLLVVITSRVSPASWWVLYEPNRTGDVYYDTKTVARKGFRAEKTEYPATKFTADLTWTRVYIWRGNFWLWGEKADVAVQRRESVPVHGPTAVCKLRRWSRALSQKNMRNIDGGWRRSYI